MRQSATSNNAWLNRATLTHRFHMSAPVIQVLKDEELTDAFQHFISSVWFQIPELVDLSKKLSLVFKEVKNDWYSLWERWYMNLTWKCFEDTEDVKLAYALFNSKKEDILSLNDNFIGTFSQYFKTENNTLYIKKFFSSVMFWLLQWVKIHNDEQPLDISDYRNNTSERTTELIGNPSSGEVIELFQVDWKWEI